MIAAKLLFLILVANGAPVLLHKGLGERLRWPVDGGLLFPGDGRPWLGSSKTLAGVAASLLATGAAAFSLGLPSTLGLEIGLFAMLGDLTSSFLKRRMNLQPRDQALGIDQIPESLLPLLALQSQLQLTAWTLLQLVIAFLLLELMLSRWLYRLHIRERPY